MTALGSVVVGLVVVMLDLRIGGFDLLADPLGWALALTGLARLRPLHPGFRVAVVAAAVGLVISIPQTFGEPGNVLVAIDSVTSTVLTFSVCTAMIALLPAVRTWAETVRWADLALAAISLVGTSISSGSQADLASGEALGVSGPGVVLVLLLVVAAVTVHIAFLLLLWRHRLQIPPTWSGAAPLPGV